jgi:hypothetical protein
MKIQSYRLFAHCCVTAASLECATSATFTVVSTNDYGAGSFRQAILDANSTPGIDTIAFNIPPAGPSTISLNGAPPIITDAVIIDGTTQPGFAGSPIIEVTPQFASFFQGLQIDAGNSVVRGLVIDGIGGDAILVNGGGTNVIQGNWLGLRPGGFFSYGNQFGVTLINSSHNLIGGTNAAQRNIISGNWGAGVRFLMGCSENRICGNFIGTDATGTNRIGNYRGIDISDGTNNVIGGAFPGERNVISGSQEFGLRLWIGERNRVIGNFIGTDARGRVALANGTDGVYAAAQSFTEVGGSDPGEGNVISGNGQNGVHVEISNNSCSNRVQGNFIGVDMTGTNALGNRLYGVYLDKSSGALVGGATSAARNIISANGRAGLLITGGFNAYPNWVQGNVIGLDATGTKPLPNAEYGIEALVTSSLTVGGFNPLEGNVVSANTLGGIRLSQCCSDSTALVAGNVIGLDQTGALPRGNGGPGVAIAGGVGMAIRANRIAFNAGLGIDLGAAGVTTNDFGDADTGANGLQNSPTVVLATNTGTSLILTGSLQSAASATYELDFFMSEFCDPSGYGEGQTFLGSATVLTDGAGNANFSAYFPSVAGRFITATATGPTGDTSEYSPFAWVTGLPEDFGLVVRRGSPLRVEWSSAAVGYKLRSTFSLTPPIVWTTISNGISDDGFVRSWSPGQDHQQAMARFFRLSKP